MRISVRMSARFVRTAPATCNTYVRIVAGSLSGARNEQKQPDKTKEVTMTDTLPKAPALDPRSIEMRSGSTYPSPHDEICAGRKKAKIGDVLGLKNFGVNYVYLAPGSASSQRHWHTKQDEFIYIVEGDIVLVTDAGEQTLTAGMVAGFPGGKPDGHHLINRTQSDAFYMEVGDRTAGDGGEYSDIDMRAVRVDGGVRYDHKDGTPYATKDEE